MSESSLVWVGNRQSEIEFCPTLFSYSITVYGTGTNNNFAFIRPHCGQQSLAYRNTFILKTIRALLESGVEYRFLFYSNQMAQSIIKLAPELGQFLICVNAPNVLAYLNSKSYTKLWFSYRLPVVHFSLLAKQEIAYNRLTSIFRGSTAFVVQDDRSSGGIGTFLVSQRSADAVLDRLSHSQLFVVSPYVKDSYSVNCHIVVACQEVLIYPPSLQIVEITDHQFLYKGADYLSADTDIPPAIKEQLYNYCTIIGEMLRDIHYQGVCGLDFLVSGEKVYLMEVNPRFQASSLLLDRALREQFGVGLIEMHMAAFDGRIPCEQIKAAAHVVVPYSALSFYLYGNPGFYSYLHERLLQYPELDCICTDQQDIESAGCGGYLYRAIFQEPVACIDNNNRLVLHQNLQNPAPVAANPNERKVALLTQGVVISQAVYATHDIKNATFDAVDIMVNGSIVNCPTKGRFLALSPWAIDLQEGLPVLSHLDARVCPIEIDLQERLAIQKTISGRAVHSIGFRTTDRVRIKHTALCQYKKEGQGCTFCHVTAKTANPYPIEDIFEVIDHYIEEVPFRHFLVGGPTGEEGVEEQTILSIAKYIRHRCNKPIYVMSVPPRNIDVLSMYKEAGVTEIAFNLEIFDRALAQRIMPGKGKIPLKQYESAFRESVRLFGRDGAVRSMLLIGLDSNASLLSGVRFLCSLGVSPMLSPFRPMTGTPLAMRVPPDSCNVLDVVNKARGICDQYGVSLGPSCKLCCNNTLV